MILIGGRVRVNKPDGSIGERIEGLVRVKTVAMVRTDLCSSGEVVWMWRGCPQGSRHSTEPESQLDVEGFLYSPNQIHKHGEPR